MIDQAMMSPGSLLAGGAVLVVGATSKEDFGIYWSTFA